MKSYQKTVILIKNVIFNKKKWILNHIQDIELIVPLPGLAKLKVAALFLTLKNMDTLILGH